MFSVRASPELQTVMVTTCKTKNIKHSELISYDIKLCNSKNGLLYST